MSQFTRNNVQAALADAECELLDGYETQKCDTTTDPESSGRNLARISKRLARLYMC